MQCQVQIEREIREFHEIPQELLKHFDKMGVDTSEVLNIYEANYLNFVFKVSVEDFDFKDKKIGFMWSLSKSHKESYFYDEKARFYRGTGLDFSGVNGTLLIFNETQKESSSGYDAVILYWAKILPTTEKIIKALKGEKIKITFKEFLFGQD